MAKITTLNILQVFVFLAFIFVGFAASAATINWTDWTASTTNNGFTGLGTITTSTSSVNVTYNNSLGVGFFHDTPSTDYWATSGVRNSSTSPYTSAFVENIPTGTDIIGLRYAGTQTLSFSETIANPVFSYVSLNGNGYSFDQDFEILSFGNSIDGNACGYWGCGTSYKSVVDLGGGNFEYQLLGTGEPHGTLRFTGAFDTVTWQSLSDEYWNGFTVGIEGTAAEILPDPDPDSGPAPVPEPSTVLLLGSGLMGLVWYRRKRKQA